MANNRGGKRGQAPLFLFGAVVIAASLLSACTGEQESVLFPDGGAGSTDGAAGESAAGGNACAAGSTRACTGPAACLGGQACGVDGAWTTCNCGAQGGASGAGGLGGSGAAGGGASVVAGAGGNAAGGGAPVAGGGGVGGGQNADGGSGGAGPFAPACGALPPDAIICTPRCGVPLAAECPQPYYVGFHIPPPPEDGAPTQLTITGPTTIALAATDGPEPGELCSAKGFARSFKSSGSKLTVTVNAPWQVKSGGSLGICEDPSSCALVSGDVYVWLPGEIDKETAPICVVRVEQSAKCK